MSGSLQEFTSTPKAVVHIASSVIIRQNLEQYIYSKLKACMHQINLIQHAQIIDFITLNKIRVKNKEAVVIANGYMCYMLMIPRTLRHFVFYCFSVCMDKVSYTSSNFLYRMGCIVSIVIGVCSLNSSRHVVMYYVIYLFRFYVAFNSVQVISRRVVGRAEETSTYSSLGFCTVNCRPTASNYQLSHLRPCRESNPSLRGGM